MTDPITDGRRADASPMPFDAFEAQLARMTGREDGVIDGLFRFTRPLTGSYFRCPPVAGGKLDLAGVGI